MSLTENRMVLFSCEIYIGYSQFLVFDTSVTRAGCAWTDAHSAQGFARRERNVSFGALVEYGHADVVVHVGQFEPSDRYERVIEVPFRVTSGKVAIGGPEEIGRMPIVTIDNGDYSLVAAQSITENEREIIDLFFEKLSNPLERSRLIVTDSELNPPTTLLEDVEVA